MRDEWCRSKPSAERLALSGAAVVRAWDQLGEFFIDTSTPGRPGLLAITKKSAGSRHANGKEQNDVPLASLLGIPDPPRGAALQTRALPHRPVPTLPPGRRDHERRRLRARLVRPPYRDTRSL